jgi:predicted regulator of Ras-like GTPase activity (Roadblock/LC7/MglB family)
MLTLMAAMDFNDLAARMSAGVAGVRACLILSRDGLSLAAHPADAEVMARQAWDVLQQMGDPHRGFMDMGTEIWVVATGAAYAAVMVATPEAKPGLLLDRMEALLQAAEEQRVHELAAPPPEPAPAMPKIVDLSNGGDHVSAPAAERRAPANDAAASSPAPATPIETPAPTPTPAPATQAPAPTSAPPAPTPATETDKEKHHAKAGSVDRVALAREFGRLLDDRSGTH